jgi:FecR protein
MRRTKFFLWALLGAMPFLCLTGVKAQGDDAPEVTDRVARISFIRGDVQIRRGGGDDWERAALNLPVVEGDELTTGPDARIEIQFDSYNFARVAENSYLKITTLRDEGVALSIPEGTLSARILNYDKDRAFFEIDAPQSTISVERAGMYRVDSGDKNSNEVHVAVTEDGEARVYSENSGFTLKNGRSARVFLSNDRAGEWDNAAASQFSDEFDSWSLDRDAQIAKRMQNSAYDKYYDRDIYGAEDLSEYGEWINSKKYGHVWRPYPTSVASYSNWSPYRYGAWRWVPPYGWVWVNDEPWGWATYHHGRWVYEDDNWYWAPYGYNRTSRSWWRPALVVVTWTGSMVCWYPLPYEYGYYNYNSYYYSNYRRHTTVNNTTIINNHTTVIVNPTPIPGGGSDGDPNFIIRNKANVPPFSLMPTSGVVAVNMDQFGSKVAGPRLAPQNVARTVLARVPDQTRDLPTLPTGMIGKTAREVVVPNPRISKTTAAVKTGAGSRQAGKPLDDTLRREKVFGNRTPLGNTSPNTGKGTKAGMDGSGTVIRDTGAVRREPKTVKTGTDGTGGRKPDTNRSGGGKLPNNGGGTGGSTGTTDRTTRDTGSGGNVGRPQKPIVKSDEPRTVPRTEPRNDRPRDVPKREEPRKEEPKKSEPKPETKKSEPKPEPKKSEPTKESKPLDRGAGKIKDGR